MQKSVWLAAAALACALSAAHAHAARIVNGYNFPDEGIGCARVNPPGSAGSMVYVEDCASFNNQEFAIGNNQILAEQLVNNGSSYGCLDLAGGATAPGTPVIIAACSLKKSQGWTIGSPGPKNQTGQIVNTLTKLCLDAEPVSSTVTQIFVNPCIASAAQAWQVK